jgi:hypothetical protein
MEKTEDRKPIFEVICALIGTGAILANLSIKGLVLENVLDATKDVAEFLVTIAVFIVARNVLRNMTGQDFVGRFEKLLREWASNNKYLVDEKSIDDERGKDGKRCYKMLVDPSSYVTAEVEASQSSKKKGAFVYLPTKSQMKCLAEGTGEAKQLTLEFSLNKSTFVAQRGSGDITDDDLKLIANKFVQRINDEYKEVGIEARRTGQRIIVPLGSIPHTEEAARLLVSLVDLVKNMTVSLSKPSDDYLDALQASLPRQ